MKKFYLYDVMYLKERILVPIENSAKTKHLNAYDVDGNPVVVTTITIAQRPVDQKVGCVALFADEKGNMTMSYSICNPEDNFSKKTAIEVARKRAATFNEGHVRLTDEDLMNMPKHLRGQAIEVCYKLLGIAS